MKTKSLVIGGVVLLMAGLLITGGCGNKKITGQSVRNNMSPEMFTLSRNHEQHRNDISRTLDTNGRQFWDDLDLFLLLHRPSRGSRYPAP